MPNPAEGAQTLHLWEEARKTLNMVRWTENSAPFQYRIRRFQRELDPQRLRVLRERTSTLVEARGNPFVSYPPDSLAAHGYAKLSMSESVYYAPDAAVLLSSAFLDRHCFRAVASERPGEIGLAFQPIRRSPLPDVYGVLWLTTHPVGLRSIEYGYTGLPVTLPKDRAGGQLEFERLSSGAWIVRRWRIRMPRFAEQSLRWKGALTTTRLVLKGLEEEGGEILDVLTGTGGPLDTATVNLTGSVYDSIAGRPLPHAAVSLAGTDYQAVTGADGSFRMTRVPEGLYTVTFSHPVLDSLGFVPEGHPIEISRGRAARVSLAIPPLASIRAAGCATKAGSQGGVLHGTIFEEAEVLPIPAARVVVSRARGGIVEQMTDTLGRYVFCDMPTGTPLSVYAELAGRQSLVARLTLVDGAPRELKLHILLAGKQVTMPDGRTVLLRTPLQVHGVVRGEPGMIPLAGARIRIIGQDTVELRTNSKGGFSAASVLPGRYRIEVDAEGYQPHRAGLILNASSVADVEIRLHPVGRDADL